MGYFICGETVPDHVAVQMCTSNPALLQCYPSIPIVVYSTTYFLCVYMHMINFHRCTMYVPHPQIERWRKDATSKIQTSVFVFFFFLQLLTKIL